eukprot:187525_1
MTDSLHMTLTKCDGPTEGGKVTYPQTWCKIKCSQNYVPVAIQIYKNYESNPPMESLLCAWNPDSKNANWMNDGDEYDLDYECQKLPTGHACFDIVCQNGGDCEDGVCKNCDNGFQGTLCNEVIPTTVPADKACVGIVCVNGGVCKNGVCENCDDGFQGTLCDEVIPPTEVPADNACVGI